MILRSPLCSPYFTPQVVLARLCANAATIIWSLIVLWQTDSLIRAKSSYGWITAYVDENWVAGTLLALSVVQMVWLVFAIRPWRYGAWGYGLLAFFWGFIAFSIYFNARTLYPTSGAVAPIIFCLAFYGFVSIPKVRVDALAS